jgi:predicted nucleic acid-binding protein
MSRLPEMSRLWAELSAHRRQTGRPIECGDAWIAATALRHGAPLITHNRKHFEGIPGLMVISEG